MIQIKAAEKFSTADTEILNTAVRMLLNIKESELAARIAAMAKNGRTLLPLYSNVRGRRREICINRQMVESILQDCNFNYVGNDKFRFTTQAERQRPMQTIAKMLRQARKELNVTQAHVAKRLNVGASYISAVETGIQKISITQAMRIAAVYGMDICISLKRKDNSPLLEDKS